MSIGPGSAGGFPDPYLDPTSGVLRNRLGITDPDELARAEADFTVVRLAQLHRQPLAGDVDLAHLCALHQRMGVTP